LENGGVPGIDTGLSISERIIREAVQPYRDATLSWRLAKADIDARKAVETAWQAVTVEPRARLGEIQMAVERIREQYATALAEDLKPLVTELDDIQRTLDESAESFKPDLPDRPTPHVTPADESAWLFASDREYFDQLAHYKAK
jgi:hypothetical protein